VLGTRLPGPGAVYISQTLNFRAPVKIGDTVVVTVTVAELIPEKSRARLACVCAVDDEIVLDGEALVKVPSARARENGRSSSSRLPEMPAVARFVCSVRAALCGSGNRHDNAAVGAYRCAGDGACFARAKKGDHRSDFLGPGQALDDRARPT